MHACRSLLTTLGGDQDDAISTLDTINSGGRGILQNGNCLHGTKVDSVHRTLHSIDKNERVAVVPRRL